MFQLYFIWFWPTIKVYQSVALAICFGVFLLILVFINDLNFNSINLTNSAALAICEICFISILVFTNYILILVFINHLNFNPINLTNSAALAILVFFNYILLILVFINHLNFIFLLLPILQLWQSVIEAGLQVNCARCNFQVSFTDY